jgi:PII-like signaling protein
MEIKSKASVLRIFISSTDKDGHQSLHESIVFKAREAALAGATVTKGILGFGASSVIHSYKFWEVSEKIPVVVEIIDEKEKVEAFYESIRPLLEEMRYGCLITLEEVAVLMQKTGKKSHE